MKKYNVQNYIRYKEDLKLSMPEGLFWDEYSRDELIIKFMPLVENLARKFATSHQAIGILSINDLIQAGNVGLIMAIDKIDEGEDTQIEISDTSQHYNLDLINNYLLALLKKHLTERESDVIRLSFGLDCDKHNAVEICEIFGIEGSYKMKGARISEIKREALRKLVEKTNDLQLPDLL